MPSYMFIYRGGAPSQEGLSPSKMQEHMAKWDAWVAEMVEAGAFRSGEALGGAGVTIGAEGVVREGPFAESREVVGGYSVVEVSDRDEAVRWAAACPIFEFDGAVEVRPLVDRCLDPD